jgi:predicted HicB family RNase H-like nuclease
MIGNYMTYKGYTGIVEFDEESRVLFGRVIGLCDVITFEGESVTEVIRAFHDSVDVYLEFCAERGESPEKPYSGQFVLRLEPRLHRELANAARVQKTSLNGLIERILAEHVRLEAPEHLRGSTKGKGTVGATSSHPSFGGARKATAKSAATLDTSAVRARNKLAPDEAKKSDSRIERGSLVLDRARSLRQAKR